MGGLPLRDESADVSHSDADIGLDAAVGEEESEVLGEGFGELAIIWFDLEERLDGCCDVLEGGGGAGFEEEGVEGGGGEDGVEVAV